MTAYIIPCAKDEYIYPRSEQIEPVRIFNNTRQTQSEALYACPAFFVWGPNQRFLSIYSVKPNTVSRVPFRRQQMLCILSAALQKIPRNGIKKLLVPRGNFRLIKLVQAFLVPNSRSHDLFPHFASMPPALFRTARHLWIEHTRLYRTLSCCIISSSATAIVQNPAVRRAPSLNSSCSIFCLTLCPPIVSSLKQTFNLQNKKFQ
jgi:hypothetical protein